MADTPIITTTVRDDGGSKPATTDKDGVTKVQLSTETPAPAVADPNRPAWLPEKFKTAEDMAKSYGELERKLGTPKPTTPPASTDAAPQIKSAADVSKTLADAGLDMVALRTEFATNGALSDATYTALAAKGIDRGQADSYIEGQKAIVREYTAGLHESVGGKEKFAGLIEWAGANLSADEIKSVNKTLVSGDAALSKTVLAGLNARYTAAMGTDPSLVNGERVPGAGGIQPFRSNNELVAAMQDPRYKGNDPAYHADVRRRVAISNL